MAKPLIQSDLRVLKLRLVNAIRDINLVTRVDGLGVHTLFVFQNLAEDILSLSNGPFKLDTLLFTTCTILFHPYLVRRAVVEKLSSGLGEANLLSLHLRSCHDFILLQQTAR